MLDEIQKNCEGTPGELSADAGYFSEENVAHAQGKGIKTSIRPRNTRHADTKPPAPRGRIPKHLSLKQRVERLLRTVKARKAYAQRKETVELVFGQIKETRGFRHSSCEASTMSGASDSSYALPTTSSSSTDGGMHRLRHKGKAEGERRGEPLLLSTE